MTWRSKIYEPPTIGKQYGEWIIIEDYRKKDLKFHDKIRTRCSCGVYGHININNLILGKSQSCGHIQKETVKIAQKARRTNESVYYNLIDKKNGLGAYTKLIQYSDLYGRDEYDRRLMSYKIKMPCGHIKEVNDTVQNPKAFVKHYTCWCKENNPFARERKRNNYTQADIGRFFGFTRQAVDLWEKDGNNIPEERLLRLFEIYETPPNIQQKMIQYKLQSGGKIT